jgi:DNA polymerase-3 subunit epsilon
MKVTEQFMLPTPKRYLRLPELYQRLFNEPMAREHEALTDADATALSFFELWRRGDITEQTIVAQQRTSPTPPTPKPTWRRPGMALKLLLGLLLGAAVLVVLTLFVL